MKKIGLIGGMSWESTTTYYRIINETINRKLGKLHSAECIIYSVDFQEIEECQAKGDWDKSALILTKAAISLEEAGADFIVICTNTMHKLVPCLQSKLHIPILHIAEVTAEALKADKVTQVGLLGTKYTLQQDFYIQILINHGIQVMIPSEQDILIINHIIYSELCLGKILETSRQEFIRIMKDLKTQGAQGIILGCTEIGLLVNQEHIDIPIYDTAEIHAIGSALRAVQKGDYDA